MGGRVMLECNLQTLIKLSKPLAEFLEENYNPYCAVVVDSAGVRVVQTIASSPKENSVT